MICKLCNNELITYSTITSLLTKYICPNCKTKYHNNLNLQLTWMHIEHQYNGNIYYIYVNLLKNKTLICNSNIDVILTLPINNITLENLNEKFKLWMTFL